MKCFRVEGVKSAASSCTPGNTKILILQLAPVLPLNNQITRPLSTLPFYYGQEDLQLACGFFWAQGPYIDKPNGLPPTVFEDKFPGETKHVEIDFEGSFMFKTIKEFTPGLYGPVTLNV